MRQTFFYLAIAAMAALAPVANAQDTVEEKPHVDAEAAKPADAVEKPAEAAPKTATEEQFPVAEENPEPQPGQIYVRENFDAWEVRCVKAAEDAEKGSKETCRLYQLLNDQDGIDVAEVNIQRLPDGGKAAAGVDFASPLGSLLTAQVVMRVDSGKAKRYPYTWCDQYGCFARFGLTHAEIKNMQKGAKSKVTIVAVADPKKPITLTMSLKGFTAAWKSIAP